MTPYPHSLTRAQKHDRVQCRQGTVVLVILCKDIVNLSTVDIQIEVGRTVLIITARGSGEEVSSWEGGGKVAGGVAVGVALVGDQVHEDERCAVRWVGAMKVESVKTHPAIQCG